MTVMATSRKTPEVIFSDFVSHLDQIIECGESSVLANASGQDKSRIGALALAKGTLGRELGRFTLYLRYRTHVVEYAYTDGRVVESLHPVWNYLERGIDMLVPMLRGDWRGHIGEDEKGNAFEVRPTRGQQGYKLFLSSMPPASSVSGQMLARFLIDASDQGVVVPKLYYDGVKSLAMPLNMEADGLVYNARYAARYGDVVTCQGRKVPTGDQDAVYRARRAIEAVGFSPSEIHNASREDLIRFNIISARHAARHWHEEVLVSGPKVQDDSEDLQTA